MVFFDSLLHFIMYVSGIVCLASAIGVFYADHRKGKIEHQRGELIIFSDDEKEYDEFTGREIERYRQTNEQIKWSGICDFLLKSFFYSLVVSMATYMMGVNLGFMEWVD
jgi:hypothetical protein